METTETSLLILNVGVRFEQMGNADAESTAAPLSGKMATLRKILVHPGEEPPGPASYLPMRIKFLRPRTTAGLHFRQVGKEFELRVLLEAAAPLPERQCVFEHWPDQQLKFCSET